MRSRNCWDLGTRLLLRLSENHYRGGLNVQAHSPGLDLTDEHSTAWMCGEHVDHFLCDRDSDGMAFNRRWRRATIVLEGKALQQWSNVNGAPDVTVL